MKTTERGLSTAHSVHLASTQHDRQGIVVFYIDFNLIMLMFCKNLMIFISVIIESVHVEKGCGSLVESESKIVNK